MNPSIPPFSIEDDPFTPRTKKAPTPPQKTLGQLDLSQELLLQYQKANELLKNAEFEDTPLNQKAQAMNSIVNILAQIIKQQEVVHNMSEITRLELALIATLKEFPEVKERFLAVYEGKLLASVERLPEAAPLQELQTLTGKETLTPELALSRSLDGDFQ